eukprot:4815022-Amphidinium_carterae.1
MESGGHEPLDPPPARVCVFDAALERYFEQGRLSASVQANALKWQSWWRAVHFAMRGNGHSNVSSSRVTPLKPLGEWSGSVRHQNNTGMEAPDLLCGACGDGCVIISRLVLPTSKRDIFRQCSNYDGESIERRFLPDVLERFLQPSLGQAGLASRPTLQCSWSESICLNTVQRSAYLASSMVRATWMPSRRKVFGIRTHLLRA